MLPRITLVQSSVSAGFPSPADDHPAQGLSLDQHLIKNPTATFLVKVSGESMIELGIFPESILIVDRSLTARHNDLVIIVWQQEFLVKKIQFSASQVILKAANKKYPDFQVDSNQDVQVWGVVTACIQKFRYR